jgi:XRE family transcriptional regulator, regulator of sulfur utilization
MSDPQFDARDEPLDAGDRARLALASNLRRARLSRGLSLRALGELTGISKAMLSLLERGEGNPTVGALGRLATALDRSVTDLVRDTTFTPEVVRSMPHDGAAIDVRTLFVSHERRRFEMTEGRIPARTESAKSSHGPGSLEYAVVFSGQVTVRSNGWEVDLEAGDAIRFSAEFDHTYVASATDVRVLTIVSLTDT